MSYGKRAQQGFHFGLSNHYPLRSQDFRNIWGHHMVDGLGKSGGGGLFSSDSQVQSQPGLTVSESAAKTVEQCLAELDALVGLSEVKTQVRKLLSMQQANAVRREADLPEVPLALHLVFTGDAGTGKTTVARIVGSLYRAAELLPKGTMVETDRSGLVGAYVGHTAIKVTEVMNEADGGVLYIDEAYSLFQGGERDFGSEAVATLVKGMEDKRNSLAVIVSGYENEMKEFIDSNPGLRSRFQTYIKFPNYTADELLEIFSRMAKAHQISVSDEVSEHLLAHFRSIDVGGSRGNARYVRNLFEAMFSEMALAASADGVIEKSELLTFELAHVPELANDGHTHGTQRFGFAQANPEEV